MILSIRLGSERRARRRGEARPRPLAAPRVPEPQRRQGRNPGAARRHRRARAAAAQPAAVAPWPRKLADQIGAIRDLVTKAPAAWSVEQVAGAFKGANKADVEEVLDSLAALGILAGYEAGGGHRWKLTRATA